MYQKVKSGINTRKELMKGVDILSEAVISTLGPNGRNVLYKDSNNQVISTKDGVSIAKHITSLENPIQELGVLMVKQAAINTANKAGDGTTTSTLLAREMISQGLSHLDSGENAVQIKRNIDKAVETVIENLRSNISEEISSEDQLEQIATISANNDPETGKLIATALNKVGIKGVVHIEESKTGETFLETVEGMQFDRGYKSPYFVTNNTTMSSILNDPAILILDQRLSTVKELLPILEAVSAQGKSLLIIAEDIDNEALATLIVNKMRGTINVCAVKAPDFGDRRKLILEDIAITTGGQVFSKDKGMKLDKFNWDWFGGARNVTVTKDQTTIIDGKGEAKNIETRMTELENQINKSNTPYEIEQLQNRLAKFAGGVAVIHVGGYTETEMLEKKDRVDDALHATKAAIEEGIVPGGGVALLYAREAIKCDNTGAKIVYNACGKPFEQILINAGYDPIDAKILGKFDLIKDINNSWFGIDINSGIPVNFKEKGIIDPTKVTRSALQNASSVAGTILLTECTITPDRESDKKISNIESNLNIPQEEF